MAIIALSIYAAYAIFVTWPFVLHPTSSTLGIVPSDLSANIARFEELAADRQAPFLPGRVPEIDAPDGLSTTWTLDLAALPSSLLFWLAALAIGGIAGSGVLGTAAYAASAFAMFLLARQVTGHAGAAFVAGLAFGFWPWVFSTATQPFGHGWVLVIPVWRALAVVEDPRPANGLWFGLAATLAMAWLQYWILVGGVLYATAVATILLLAWREGGARKYVRPLALSTAPVVVALSVFGALAVVASTGEIPARSAEESYSYSARPLMYVVPHPEHPLFGDRTGRFLRSEFDGSSRGRPFYADIYVGLSTIAFAILGIAWLLAALRRRGPPAQRRAIAAGVLAGALVVVGFLFSMPPRVSVFGVAVPMPGEAIVSVTSVFRTTHRFAAVVMLGLCLLLALGLRALVRGRPARVAAAVIAASALIVAADVWGQADFGETRLVDHPDVYDALRGLPHGTVAVFPMSSIADQRILFERGAHERPLFNGARPGTRSASGKLDLQALADEGNASRLATLGVRYVVVLGGADQPWQPRPEQTFPGLAVIRRAPDGTAFRVTAAPEPLAWVSEGFWAPERQGDSFYRWLTSDEGVIEVRGACTVCVRILEFTAASLAQQRTLEVRNEQGRVVARRVVGIAPTRVRFLVVFNKRADFRLRVTPGPQSIREATGALDARDVSIQISVPIRVHAASG